MTNMILTRSAAVASGRQEDEPVVNFVYLTHDLLNRPCLLIPFPLSSSDSTSLNSANMTTNIPPALTQLIAATSAAATTTDQSPEILSALSALADHLNLLFLPNSTRASPAPALNPCAEEQQPPPLDANANRLNPDLALENDNADANHDTSPSDIP